MPVGICGQLSAEVLPGAGSAAGCAAGCAWPVGAGYGLCSSFCHQQASLNQTNHTMQHVQEGDRIIAAQQERRGAQSSNRTIQHATAAGLHNAAMQQFPRRIIATSLLPPSMALSSLCTASFIKWRLVRKKSAAAKKKAPQEAKYPLPAAESDWRGFSSWPHL